MYALFTCFKELSLQFLQIFFFFIILWVLAKVGHSSTESKHFVLEMFYDMLIMCELLMYCTDWNWLTETTDSSSQVL